MARMKWGTRYGLYLAAVGSACGLGNMWRFPYVVGENGGGVFVLLYVFLALAVGLPLMIGELILGRSQRSAVIPATRALQQRHPGQVFGRVGQLSVFLTLILLSYYAIVSGWVLYFFIQFLKETMMGSPVSSALSLRQVTENSFLQMGLTSVHLIFCMVVVARGVQEGIERWIGSIIPIFAVLLVFLIYESLSLPSAQEALRFLFYPDFSHLTWFSLGEAVGHVCFTLSVGFGTMVTFGSYLQGDEHIPTVGFRVTGLDTLLSIAAGLLVFPIALSVTKVPLTDPGLLFEALPQFLLGRRGGAAFGTAFFLCLYLAALGASIGLSEVVVANLMALRRQARPRAAWMAGILIFVVSAIPAMVGPLIDGSQGTRFLVLLDSILMNWFIPLAALGMCWIFARGMNRQDIESAFLKENRIEGEALLPQWLRAVRWVIPGLIVLGLVLQTIGVAIANWPT